MALSLGSFPSVIKMRECIDPRSRIAKIELVVLFARSLPHE